MQMMQMDVNLKMGGLSSAALEKRKEDKESKEQNCTPLTQGQDVPGQSPHPGFLVCKSHVKLRNA